MKFEALEKEMCKELEAIEQKMKSGVEMSTADLEKVDKLRKNTPKVECLDVVAVV